MIVTLSTGEKVHFKEVWTHGLEKRFNIALFKDGNEVSAAGIYAAYEAVLGDMIDKIQKESSEVTYSPGWLEGISEPDYLKLRDAVDKIGGKGGSRREKNS